MLALAKADPSKPKRQIAKECGMARTTVMRILKMLDHNGEIKKMEEEVKEEVKRDHVCDMCGAGFMRSSQVLNNQSYLSWNMCIFKL